MIVTEIIMNQKVKCSKCGRNRCSECGSWTGWWRNKLETIGLFVSILAAIFSIIAAFYTNSEKVIVSSIAGEVTKMSANIAASTPDLPEEYRRKLSESRTALLPYLPWEIRNEVKNLTFELSQKSSN